MRLERELKKTDRSDVHILDYVGYVHQSREEIGVPFTQLAGRYGLRSVLINLTWSLASGTGSSRIR